MKTFFLAALALPILLTGCGTYVGYDGGYGPGYGPAYGPDYYDGVTGDVAIYGYDRGGYQPHYHHYDGGAHNYGGSHNSSAVASHSFAHANSTRVASAGHVGGGHAGGGGGAAHASASMGGGHVGGGHR